MLEIWGRFAVSLPGGWDVKKLVGMEFKKESDIEIGQQFYKKGKVKRLCVVVDIIKNYSTLKKCFIGKTYYVKQLDGMATNTHEVSYVTIVMGWI